ncbi:MAG: N-acetyltransferase [Deltaproteobacteria bacterium]|nr:N-acetyltransferase [Deltaproteobacteria bacterium]
MIRKAKIHDAKIIHGLLHYYADRGLLLPRSLSDIYDHIRDYFVNVDGEDDKVTGVCSTHIVWENLAEIRSLAVEETEHGRKIGSRLVEACLSDAVTLGIFRIFTLTYVPDYFKRFGFEIVDKSVLPHKVWADCIKCVKFPECDETAMLLEL